jgi:hypothetical protein
MRIWRNEESHDLDNPIAVKMARNPLRRTALHEKFLRRILVLLLLLANMSLTAPPTQRFVINR